MTRHKITHKTHKTANSKAHHKATKKSPKAASKTVSKKVLKKTDSPSKVLKTKKKSAGPQPEETLVPVAVAVAPVSRKKIERPAPAVPEMKDPKLCHELLCEVEGTSNGYCRIHYIRNWRKIKRKELILKERKLNQYIEELVSKYPEKYIETIKQDLGNDHEFLKVVRDLDLSEGIPEASSTTDSESIDSYLDNIRRDLDVGVGSTPGAGGLDEDDEAY